MPLNRRPQIMSSALKTLTAAVASAVLLTSVANAAGLGKLTVLSALGQPLRAEIELTAVSSEEASNLVAKLASPEAYRAANVEFNPALLSLRFAVEQRGGRQFVRITSPQPLNEPFVDLLLELSWDGGRLVREYTFLLDPAELRSTQSAQVAPAPAARSGAAQAPRPTPAETARPQRGARADETAGEPAARAAGMAASPSRYRVKSGDTLSLIAGKLKPVDVSLDMMLVALYRANPDAFIGNNMNRLKSGQILSVPSGDNMRGIDAEEAHGTVVAHAADFNAYRSKLAGQVATSAPAREAPAGQSATGRITAKVEERPTAANESQDQLRLSKAAPNRPGTGAAAPNAEDAIAREKELADAQTRVKELEKNVNELESLITVKSQTGADATQRADAPAAPAATPTPPVVVAQADTEPKPAPKIKTAPKPVAPETPAEPGLLDTLMDNILYLGAGAAVLLLAALGLSQRRKQKVAVQAAPNPPTILGSAAQPGQSMFAETGGQSVDTHDSVFNSSFAPSASQLDTNEVDPVAEADVYIAYGRDAQAEEILKEALRTHPERLPVRLKLLEIYASRKDQRAFETQAGELYGITRGQGEEWAQAAALGRSIDPHNPLYASSGAAAGMAVAGAGALGAGALGAGVAAGAAAHAHDDLLSKDLDDAFLAADAANGSHEPDRAPMSFDQHFADAMGSAQPAQSSAAAAAPAAAPADDDHVLDFDLGGLAFEPAAAHDATALPTPDVKEITSPNEVRDLEFDMSAFDPAPAPVPAAEEPLDFGFDMDFGTPATPNPVPQPDPHPAEDDLLAHGMAFEAPNTDIDMANLAKEFDLPDLPTELHEGVPPVPELSTPATELKDPLFDLDTMDFGLEEQQPARANPAPDLAHALADPLDFDLDEPAPPAAASPLALDDDPFALPALDGLPAAAPAPAASAAYAPHDMLEPRLDAPTFDLDLADSPLPLPDVHSLDTGDGPVELSPAHMEMETKLDLAIAYQEIGDKEGARELLDEVIKGGTSEQVNRANAMRAALA